jgi:imidazole glycerol-phosphate synthase subunit HisH
VIALIDYGAGNLTSVRKGLAAAGAQFFSPKRPHDLDRAAGIVIPGVGHFAATRAIEAEWRAAILASAGRGIPLLGICLGLQYLFEGSDEAPDVAGLGLLRGRSTLLPPTVKVPHVGWNDLRIERASALLEGIADGTPVYFTHSYAVPVTGATVASAEHGARFAAAVERERVFGVQFHPEKSGDAGLRVLRSFVQISQFPDSQISRCSRNA